MVFQTVVRTANEMGMFKSDLSKWLKYREARNITSHTYNEEKADQVARLILKEDVAISNAIEESVDAQMNQAGIVTQI